MHSDPFPDFFSPLLFCLDFMIVIYIECFLCEGEAENEETTQAAGLSFAWGPGNIFPRTQQLIGGYNCNTALSLRGDILACYVRRNLNRS